MTRPIASSTLLAALAGAALLAACASPHTASTTGPAEAGNLGSTMGASPSRTEAPQAECANPNRMTVAIERFDASRQTLVADIGAVLAGVNVDVDAPNTSPRCMSFPGDADCPPVTGAQGLSYGGVPAPGPQRPFSVR